MQLGLMTGEKHWLALYTCLKLQLRLCPAHDLTVVDELLVERKAAGRVAERLVQVLVQVCCAG